MTENSQYIKVDNVKLASCWIPTYDSDWEGDLVTLNKPYKIFRSDFDGSFCIMTDNGLEMPLHLMHNGYLVREIFNIKELINNIILKGGNQNQFDTNE